jgi:VIT1/CCC1 family predicted Fe2+/Mn2+ transporter
MRFIVFLLGFVASLIAGFFGWFWLDYVSNREIFAMVDKDYPDCKLYVATIMPNYTDFDATTGAAAFLLIGAALGILGSILTLMRRGRHGAVLMILAVIGPALFDPLTLAFTGLLGFAGILSVFIRRRPPPAPAAE